MLNRGQMTETVRLYRKQTTGTSPEGWEQVGNPRRAHIRRMGNDAALSESARLNVASTHVVTVLADDDYYPAGHGGRLLVSERDGTNYLINVAVPTGLLRRGRQAFLSLSVAEIDPEVVT